MIEFATLLLGIVTGPREIVLHAEPQVAAVEIRLDGTAVARDAEAPWKLTVDFGPELLPRELVALALDGEGRELGRAAQPVNLPRPPAEATAVLDRDADGRPVAVRIGWESVVGRQPTEVNVQLDGEPLTVADPHRVELAGLVADDDALHLLGVELRFGDRATARAQLAFGGPYLDTTQAELTAVPVRLRGGRSPRPSSMAGWFLRGGQPLKVVGVERGGSDLAVVRAPGVRRAVSTLARGGQGVSGGIGSLGVTDTGGASTMASSTATATAGEAMRRAAPFGEGQRVRLVLPRARSDVGQQADLDLFATSPEIRPGQGGMFWLLGLDVQLPDLSPRPRVSDALAVAALQAAHANRRRAVLLVVAGGWPDESRYSGETVRRFLRSLNVPLHVWQIGEGAPPDGWQPTAVITSYSDLVRASRRLGREIDRQRVAWVEGSYLPHTIRVAGGARVDPVVPR